MGGSVMESAGLEYPGHPPPLSLSQYPGYYMPPPPGPVLINPPHIPTYNYGIPPSPLLYHSQHSLPFMPPRQPPPAGQGLRRAGSINAKILNAEARSGFSCPVS